MKLRSTSGRLRTAMTGIAVATSALLAIAGCGAGGSPEGAAGKLTVLVEGGGKAELQPIADLYQKETGTTVELVELPYDGLYDRIQTELGSGKTSRSTSRRSTPSG